MGLDVGALVGTYRVVRRLGAGASGEVFEAVDDAIERRVALKVLRPATGGGRARLEREAKSANRVRHPGVVEVLALGELDDGRPYLVLPLLEGRTLREELDAVGALPLAEAWRITREAAGVLGAASEAGVTHRDVKPENLFLELPSRRVRVLDFGLARLAVPEGAAASSLSAAGAAIGTPPYMAPEQWWSEGIDGRSDQYALAAVLHELVTGAPPYGRGEVAKLLEAHLHAPIPALPGASRAGEAWLARALAKDKDDRFASWDELVRAGDDAFGGGRPEAPSEGGGRQPSARALPVIDDEAAVAAWWGGRGLAPRAAALVALALSLGVWRTLGYVGGAGRDLREVLHIGGWGAVGAFGWGSLAAASVLSSTPTTVRPLAWALLSLAALSGAVGTYTGWEATLGAVARAAPEVQLGIFHEGAYEASSSRFVGFALASSAALALGFALGAGQGQRLVPTAPPRSFVTGAVGLGFFVALATTLGARSASASAAVASLSLVALALEAQRGPSDAASGSPGHAARALACVLAPVLAVVAGLSRVEARASVVFVSGLTRAERLDELARIARDRASALATGLVAVVLVSLAALGYVRRHELELGRVRRVAALGIGGLLLGVACDQALAARFLSHRAVLQAELAAQLGLLSRVSPPSAAGLEAGPPHRAAGVVVSNDLIAVDGKPVAPPSALTTPEGVTNLARDIAHAIAAHAESRTEGAPDLSVVVDRDTRWSVAAWTLAACRRGGASRIELLFTRGEQPRLRVLAEDAAHVVLPEDFVAVPVTVAERGVTFPPERPYAEVASTIERATGPLVLAAP